MDTHEALRLCEVRPVQVEASEASYVLFDQVDDPWPGESMLVIFEDGVIFSVVVLLSATIVHDEFALPFLVYAEGRTRSTLNTLGSTWTSIIQ